MRAAERAVLGAAALDLGDDAAQERVVAERRERADLRGAVDAEVVPHLLERRDDSAAASA